MKIILTLGALLLSASLTFAADGDKPQKPPGGESGKGGKGGGPRGNPEEMFKKADTNGDGTLSKDEFMATPRAQEDTERAEKAFGMRDKDKDGKLSKEEFAHRPDGGRPPGGRPDGDRKGKKKGGEDKGAKPAKP